MLRSDRTGYSCSSHRFLARSGLGRHHLSSLQSVHVSTIAPFDELPPWYAICTRSNHEQVASAALDGQGLTSYLPKYRSRRRWSDRFVESDLPLFPGYVFCRFDPLNRMRILKTPGVFSIVAFGSEPAAVPDEEIAAVQSVLQYGRFAEPCPYLREGQRIRIKEGSMKDLEGILVKKKTGWRLVVSVTMLQRSVSVEIDAESASAA